MRGAIAPRTRLSAGTLPSSSCPTLSRNMKPLLVQVVNTSAQPVLVRDVDNPARQPFQATVFISISDGVPAGSALLDVPSGRQLVIEYVSASVQLPTGQKVQELRVEPKQGSTRLSQGSRPGGQAPSRRSGVRFFP